jgi:predicted nucleic acid-binding protein
MLLLDTNVMSELRKPATRRDDRFNAWAEASSPSDTYLSVITLLELRAGIGVP